MVLIQYQVKMIPLLILMLTISIMMGCNKLDPGPATHFTYQFDPDKSYRIQAHYERISHLVKMHNGKIFSDQEDILYVNATYSLSVKPITSSTINANYKLNHLSLNDNKGKIRVEIGPHGGQVTWYDEDSTLADYLGEKAFKRYLTIIQEPIATIIVSQRGEQLSIEDPDMSANIINLALLELMSKNRVLGKYIVRAFKIPPVLMTIFPDRAIKPGEKWSYQGVQEAYQDEWQQGLLTHFHYLKMSEQLAIITYQSQLEFEQEELNKLGQMLGIDQLDNMIFNKGQFQINGQAEIDSTRAIPKQGKMEIKKEYSFNVESEKWSYREKEIHQFKLTEH